MQYRHSSVQLIQTKCQVKSDHRGLLEAYFKKGNIWAVKIRTMIFGQTNFGLKLDLFRTKLEEISDLLFQSEDKLNPKDLVFLQDHILSKK